MRREARGLLPKNTVLVAANDGSHRATLIAFLQSRGHRVVVVGNGSDALRLALAGGVDLVITGPVMPGLDGYQLTKNLRELLPELPVILMSAGGPTLDNDLLDCATALGAMNANSQKRAELSAQQDAAASLGELTRRQREVLDLLVFGHGNKAVARMLSISPRTVENHRAQVMRKTHARSVAELVRLALSARDAEQMTDRAA